MICRTILLNKEKTRSSIKREDLACKLYYVSHGKLNIKLSEFKSFTGFLRNESLKKNQSVYSISAINSKKDKK